jgi:hypothetical protein
MPSAATFQPSGSRPAGSGIAYIIANTTGPKTNPIFWRSPLVFCLDASCDLLSAGFEFPAKAFALIPEVFFLIFNRLYFF